MISYKAPLVLISNLLRKSNHHLKFAGVALFDNKKTSFFVKKFRYVYIKIYSEVSCKINLYWYADNQLYQTGDLQIQAGTAIYEFDIALTKANSNNQSVKNSYFQYGYINNFSIRCKETVVVKWSKTSTEKLVFKKDVSPVVRLIEYPSVIHLELTRRCNLNCYMCRENRKEDLKKIGLIDLKPNIFYKMLPVIKNAAHLALFGWGEPLCHPNFKKFIEAIGDIKENRRLNSSIESGPYIKPYTNFTTNGYLMNEDLIDCIIRNHIDEIVFSIDSPNAENYNFIRKGSDFEQIIANLQILQRLKIKNDAKNPTLTIEFVAMRRNIEELPDMVRLTAELKVKKMIVTSIVVSTKGIEDESLYYHQELANKMFDEAEQIAQKNDIAISLPDRFGTKSDPQGYCNDPQDIFYVRAEGTVIPCCAAANSVIGDLNTEEPLDIWMGQPRQKFIDSLKKGTLTGTCRTCHKFTGNDINLKSTHIKV